MFSLPYLTQLTQLLRSTPIDDPIDKLSCLISAFIYIFFALLTTAQTYLGTPIECYTPKKYSYKWTQFAENYCFLKDTYWFPTSELIADVSEPHKQRHRVTYYQWSCVYLSIGALVFMIPKFIWKMAQKRTDMSLIYFCDTTNYIRSKSPNERAEKVEEMSQFLRDKIAAYNGPSMSAVYLLVKVLYVLVVLVQFIMLSVFLNKKDDLYWGWNLLVDLLNGNTWEKTGMFPRITFCDFTTLLMAGLFRHDTIECLIVLNEFNEKIYLFLWFWLVIIFFFTLNSAIELFMRCWRVHFVSNLLHTIHKKGDQVQKAAIQEFCEDYLTLDGKLILSFVKAQSDVVAQEMVIYMYDDFVKNYEPKAMQKVDRFVLPPIQDTDSFIV